MCSIAGAAEKKQVERMLDDMEHRAPDDSGISDVGDFFLGMGRLSIIDLLSPGLCPIKDGDYVLVFNGELYNYVELRDELKNQGYVFNTQSDSEVVLKAYEEWGEECLRRFNWMGAIAISNGNTVFLARDITGEKPLYYTERPFRFASEAKALNFVCKEFPPAHFGTYGISGGIFQLTRYWSEPTEDFTGTLDSAVEQLDELLADSVRLRTRADVPCALYFSGGIDSTLISTYHNFDYKITYHDQDYNAEDFKKLFPTILYHLDYPIESFSAFGLWKLAEKAYYKKIKVVLSGEGADELFGGYVRYVPNEFNRKAQQIFPSYTALFPYKDMLFEEFTGNMRELLRMGDRMAAAWGIENRCPFLDRRIIEFAMRLPMEYKIKDYETKVILRRLIMKRFPSYVFEEKRGLYCSVNKWLNVPEEGFGKDTYRQYQASLL